MAAASGAGIAYYTAAHNHINRLSFPTKQRRRSLLVMRNSGEESGSTATEQESETPVEVPKGPPSLISALNVEKALRGLAITEVDHYGRLGLQTGCSYDQVSIAFRNKVAQLRNKGLNEEDSTMELELLKESHSVLSSAERRMYDWSLTRSEKPDR